MKCPECNFQSDVYNYCPICHRELINENETNLTQEKTKKNYLKKNNGQATFDDIFNAMKPTPEEYLKEGDKYYSEGNIKKAIKSYDKAIDASDNPYKKSYNYCFKGRRLIEKGMGEKGLKCFDEGINLCPENLDNLYEKGKYLFNHEDYEESLACFENLINLDPAKEDFFHYRIECLECLGKYEEALESCDDGKTEYLINKKETLEKKITNASKELEKCEKELLSIKDEDNKENLEKKIKNLKELLKNQRIKPLIDKVYNSKLSNRSKIALKELLVKEELNETNLDDKIDELINQEIEEQKEAELFYMINNSGLDENHQKRLRRKVEQRGIWDEDELNNEIISLKRVHR